MKTLNIIEKIVNFGVSIIMAIGLWGGINYFRGETIEINAITYFMILVWAIVIHNRIGQK